MKDARRSPPAAATRLDPAAHPIQSITVKLASVIQAKKPASKCSSCGSEKSVVF